MKFVGFLPVLFLVLITVQVAETFSQQAGLPEHALNAYNKLLSRSKKDMSAEEADDIFSLLEFMTRQGMLQDLEVQEKTRSGGASGIKQLRLIRQGTKSYYTDSYSGYRTMAVHDHANNIRIAGIGEFVVVLNGLEFRTRHNDYQVLMPHRTSHKYHKTEDIPYPEVPPAVLAKETVEEQIIEMREWFKAWRDNDVSKRDFTPYFKPVLCYLEGGWTLSDQNTIDESFDSVRHSIDATSWLDLQDKVKFTSYVGKKDTLENYAYLPTTILKFEDNTLHLAQWNYRILCHPVSQNVHPSAIHHVDDLHVRKAFNLTMQQQNAQRSARYKLNPENKDTWNEKKKIYDLTDILMGEIPGADNYQGNITDDSIRAEVRNFVTGKVQNAAYYHRWFTTTAADAMGKRQQHRAFADQNIFVAVTTQDKIAPMTVNLCEKNKDTGTEECTKYTQRVTYAIPLEMIYMTPLLTWNPYDIEYKGKPRSEYGQTVEADGRKGKEDNPYNGTHLRLYYHTPADFFSAPDSSDDPADTVKGPLWILDKKQIARKVVASGHRIILPDIPGVGNLRTRYPIPSLYQEGTAEYKEVVAMRDILLRPMSKRYMFHEDFPAGNALPYTIWTAPSGMAADFSAILILAPSNAESGSHTHEVAITPEAFRDLQSGKEITVTTSVTNDHSHVLVIGAKPKGGMKYKSCDGRKSCIDKHPGTLKNVNKKFDYKKD